MLQQGYGRGIGAGFASGTGQTVNTAPPPDPTLSSILAQFDNQLVEAQKLLERARSIGDAVHGGEPTAVDNAKGEPEPGSIISRFQQRVCYLDQIVGMLSGQIGRIERAL